jgi:hypothetical protein
MLQVQQLRSRDQQRQVKWEVEIIGHAKVKCQQLKFKQQMIGLVLERHHMHSE